ncbi:MAG TPA: FtsX-like permease family protein [Bacteroidales bacterium]|nr:FtsX-like permease family protein [Bacteroidales bacterium]HRZ48801.1 FtsX-like permease family protein [Bacteroidales bacterium]
MKTLKLAFRNLLGAGLRTWLNVSVLSFTFVVIVFYNGMLDGWNRQAMTDTRAWETGAGQLWHPAYDPYDPFSLADAHGRPDPSLDQLLAQQELAPVLITQATIYPEGRMLNVLLKGIEPGQQILALPTALLNKNTDAIPALIGKRMAKMARLKSGDRVMLQWRDRNGAFDARELEVAGIFSANVPTVDQGQIWIPLEILRIMTGMAGEATMLVAGKNFDGKDAGIWQFKDEDFLMKDYKQLMESKKGGSRVIYFLLLAIALLAIFDTQVLSVFRRQREIGTYIALGMTRWQVVKIFTAKGGAHSLLALLLGALYGIPLLWLLHSRGIPMPASTDDMGISITDSIIPVYGFWMVVSSMLLVVVSATIVSYFPASRIARMKPTDALKGKIK